MIKLYSRIPSMATGCQDKIGLEIWIATVCGLTMTNSSSRGAGCLAARRRGDPRMPLLY